jgi:hypothetical protein
MLALAVATRAESLERRAGPLAERDVAGAGAGLDQGLALPGLGLVLVVAVEGVEQQ